MHSALSWASFSGRQQRQSLHLHNIRGTLTTTALDGLQLASQLRGQDFKDPSIGVLVDERPVEVEDDKLLSGHVDIRGYWLGYEVVE